MNEAIYRPDLLVIDPTNGQIVWIVEVETSDPGKSIVGAAVLADICMTIENEKGHQPTKPHLLFVFYRSLANLDLAEKKLAQLRQQNRIRQLAEVLALTEKDALKVVRCLDGVAGQ